MLNYILFLFYKIKNHIKTMGTLIGYARVTPHAQDLQVQLDALIHIGCIKEKILIDNTKTKRYFSNLSDYLEQLKEGDTLVVWRLDVIGCSMYHLILLMEELKQRGVGFKSICDNAIDTTSDFGEIVSDIFASLARLEQRLNHNNSIVRAKPELFSS